MQSGRGEAQPRAGAKPTRERRPKWAARGMMPAEPHGVGGFAEGLASCAFVVLGTAAAVSRVGVLFGGVAQ